MKTVSLVKNEIEPLLSRLMQQLSHEGRATEHAVYRRIRRSLREANDEFELAVPLRALSTSSCVGFELSTDANVLLDRILLKTERLWADIDKVAGPLH